MPSRRGSKQSDSDVPQNDELTLTNFRAELSFFKEQLRAEITTAINNIVSAKFEELKKKIIEQDKEMAVLRDHLIHIERQRLLQARLELASNVVISGCPEDDDETSAHLSDKIDDIFTALDADDIPIDKCRITRVGRPNGCRLIKITTPTRDQRNLLLSRAKRLRDDTTFRGVYLNADRCFLDRKEFARLREKQIPMPRFCCVRASLS